MPKKAYLDSPIGMSELACVYASLILADDEIPITAEKIDTILKAAELNVDSLWPSMFAKALTGVNVRDLISGVSGGGFGGGMAGPAAGAEAAVAEEEKKEEKPPEPEEDSEDEDFGLSLFD